MNRLGPEVIKLEKKLILKKNCHGFTNCQAETKTGGFSRTTVGCNTLLRVFQLNLDGRLPNKSYFQ